MRNNYSLSLLFLAIYSFSSLLHANRLFLNETDWPPYLFPESTSNLTGLGKDVLNVCLPKNNFTIQYLKLPIKRTHLYMKSGEIDISLYSFKNEREEFVVYGKVPIFTTEYGFAVRADSHIDIQKIEDLEPLIIGHLAGLSHTPEILKIIDKKRINGQLSEGNSIDAMFAQLLSSTPRFEIMPNSKQTFFWRSTSLGIADKIKVLNFTADYRKYFVTVSKNTQNISDIPGFLDAIDKCIANMHHNGDYDLLLKKYNLDGLIK